MLSNKISSSKWCWYHLKAPKIWQDKADYEYWEWEMAISSTGLPENVIDIINHLKDSKLILEKEKTDIILNVLTNFVSSKLIYKMSENKFNANTSWSEWMPKNLL